MWLNISTMGFPEFHSPNWVLAILFMGVEPLKSRVIPWPVLHKYLPFPLFWIRSFSGNHETPRETDPAFEKKDG